MICKKVTHDFTAQNWQRINMRRVEHLIGAEMIHNLYNRHWPRINSIRFRHTMTYFDNGLVESFAPVSEWQYLQKVLSLRFRKLDPVLIREINAILHPTYDLIHELLDRLDAVDITKLSNEDLALNLLDVLDLPLGDIYKLNVVQIEYGLTRALQDILSDYEESPEDKALLLSKLIAPGKMTMSQQEELAVDAIRQAMIDASISDPYVDDSIKLQLQQVVDEYAPRHCAYGELPPTIDEYRDKILFMNQSSAPIKTSAHVQAEIDTQREQSQKLLARLKDDRLNILCPLMAEIGDFRDKNKAKLGETMPYRHAMVDEIVRRTELTTDDARLYLKAEFVNLLLDNVYVDAGELASRRRKGVHFVRTEYLDADAIKPQVLKTENTRRLSGICASQGNATGRVVVVRGKEDNALVREGDVMVAVGTDFDVLEAMYRASAIITEEGGLLSHASVVSRELKKPCLIGMSRATSVFKNGMKVHVNATDGYVEVMQK